MSRTASLLVLGLAVTWSGALHAQDSAAAQALFDKAVVDLEAGRFESACPALAESQRLDARPGTLFALADCEAEFGKIATALEHYHEYLGWVSRLTLDQKERHADRVLAARERVEALQAKVPTLTLVVSARAPAGLVVERDGVVLQGAALGVALPIDPGEHVIVTRAPGAPPESVTVTLGPGDSKLVELPLRAELPPPTLPRDLAARASASANTKRQPDAVVVAGPSEGSTQRTWAFIALGAGAAGIATGAVAGLLVLDKKATVSDPDHCQGHVCDHEGALAAKSGQRLATVSNVAFGLGLAGVAAGTLLFLTAPRAEPEQPSASLRPLVGAVRRGAWVGVERSF